MILFDVWEVKAKEFYVVLNKEADKKLVSTNP